MSEFNGNNSLKEFLLENKNNIHINESAKEKAIENGCLNNEDNVENLLEDIFNKEFIAEEKDNNIYIQNDNFIIAINSSTFELITVHNNDFEIEETNEIVAEEKLLEDTDESVYGEIVHSKYMENKRPSSTILQIEDRLGETINNIVGSKVHLNPDKTAFICDIRNSSTYDLREKDLSDLKDFGFLKVKKAFEMTHLIEEGIDSKFLDMPCNKFYMPKSLSEIPSFKNTFLKFKDEIFSKYLNAIKTKC